jgi:hypothetical protein
MSVIGAMACSISRDMRHSFSAMYANASGATVQRARAAHAPGKRMTCRMSARILTLSLLCIGRGACQNAPDSPTLPWHSIGEQAVKRDAVRMRKPGFAVDSSTTYILADLVALAEAHNPETRAAWPAQARRQP